MAHVLGHRGATVVAAIAVLTTTNTTLLALTAGSRVIYGMAKAGALPGTLAAVHPTRGTPVRAIIVAVLVAAGFAAFGEFTIIAAITDFAVYVVFLAVNATVIILRRSHPELSRPFAVPVAIHGVPIVPILGLGSVGLMMSQLDPLAIAVGGALCGVGLGAGWLARARR
jgi:APA family basic amino acid/polyamine antiporter